MTHKTNEYSDDPEINEVIEEVEFLMRYAGFWRRLSAFFLDYFSLGIIAMASLFFSFGGEKENANFFGKILLVVFFGNIFLQIFFYWKDGESIGYKILGLRIRDKKSMKKPSFLKLFSRFFFKWIFFGIFIPTIIAMIFIAIAVFSGLATSYVLYTAFFLPYVGLFLPLFRMKKTKKRQTLYDRMSGVVVEKTKHFSSSWIWRMNIFFISAWILIIGAVMSFSPSYHLSGIQTEQTEQDEQNKQHTENETFYQYYKIDPDSGYEKTHYNYQK